MPPAGITAQELRARDWWAGPELYLIVDDYDLVSAATPAPLAGLASYVPQAREIGLHIVLARRVAGMSRAATDPVLSRIRDLGTTGLLLSGDPREGVLLGSERAVVRPPGRGALVRRSQPTAVIQIATTDTDGL
jgi:S-DNA-T family DNA segregation ATPase FtsK/SpoIIIE